MEPAGSTGSVALIVPAAVEAGSLLVIRVRAARPEGAEVHGEVALLCTVAYRYRELSDGGGTHLATARHAEVAALRSLPARARGADYDVEVPLLVPYSGPPNAETSLVSVDWAVRVRLAVGDGPPAQAVEKVRVVSASGGVGSRSPGPARRAEAGHALVTIEGLAARHIQPGMCLAGTLDVRPLLPGRIRSVRLDLVLREHVLGGPAGALDARGSPKVGETVVADVELARGLAVGEDLSAIVLPFQVLVPLNLPAPSISTAEFKLEWLLRAVVSRALHRDATAELNLTAGTVVA